jgi:hypothetical protein
MNDDALRERISQIMIHATFHSSIALIPPLMHWMVTESPDHSYMIQLPSVFAYAFIVWLYSPVRWFSVNLDAFTHSGYAVGALALVPLIYVMLRAIATSISTDDFHTKSNHIGISLLNFLSVMSGVWLCWTMRTLSAKEPHWARRWPQVYSNFRKAKKAKKVQ